MKKMYFEVELRIEDYYFGDGIIVVENDIFEGYIALDYITGSYQEGMLSLEVLNFEPMFPDKYMEYQTDLTEFELPNDFYLSSEDEGEWVYFKIKNKVKDVKRQKRFNEFLSEIKDLHQIPKL